MDNTLNQFLKLYSRTNLHNPRWLPDLYKEYVLIYVTQFILRYIHVTFSPLDDSGHTDQYKSTTFAWFCHYLIHSDKDNLAAILVFIAEA